MSVSVKSESIAQSWGRSSSVSPFTFISCLLVITCTPLLVFYFFISAFFFDADLIKPLFNLQIVTNIPLPTAKTFTILGCWLTFQVSLALLPDILHTFLKGYKGGKSTGSITPAGNKLSYNINGLQAWVISNVTFILGAFYFDWFSPTIVIDHWGELLWLLNIAGFSLATFVYIKAYYFPSYSNDRKFSNSKLYNYFMGIELNPRIGFIDLKLFFNGRPGIIAWSIINLSFASAQYSLYGTVTNSMILVNFFQLLYILYFFWKESWYLKTIDIHHDHFGWMLAWGDLVWLPYMYTLQGLFLVFNPVELSPSYFTFVLTIGLIGFYIFASSNNQKDRFRTDDKAPIWGEEPKCISCYYYTSDKTRREAKLLLSGWWGEARHFNYTGDLLLSLAYSLACGTSHLFPYFYFFFLSILLVHRCIRDEMRCSEKYGPAWKLYCERVPYRLVPYIW